MSSDDQKNRSDEHSENTSSGSDQPTNSGDRQPPEGSETYSLSQPEFSLAEPGPKWSVPEPQLQPLPQSSRGKPKKPRMQIGDFWALMGCNLMVFIASVCILVIELTASRLIAKHVGSSLYTWTSVIGVVLAGITVGNYVGGFLADRFSPRKLLGWLFLISSALCFSVLWLDGIVGDLPRPERLDWPTWVLCVVAMIFLLPSIAMGTISPVVASLALSRNTRTGITVGNVYAWGALGSIVGTFLTGFYLIGTFGTKAIVAMTSATLGGTGAVVAVRQTAFRVGVVLGWLQFVLFVGLAAGARSDTLATAGTFFGSVVSLGRDHDTREAKIFAWREFGSQLGENLHWLGLTLGLRNDHPDEFHDESGYSYINVGYTFEAGEEIKYLKLDKLIHSYYNPLNPTELYYDYELIYAAVTERAASQWNETTSVPLEAFDGWDEIADALPGEIRYDADSGRLEVCGAMSPEQRLDLLQLNPVGDYWLAVEDLHRLTTVLNWGGFTPIALDRLPEGTTIPESLSRSLRHDPTAEMFTAYEPIDDEALADLIAAAPHSAYYSAINRLYHQSRQVSTLFIGGGGFIFPRWIEEKFPFRPRIDVAEIDPEVKRVVQQELGLPPDGETAVNTYIGDARNFVDDRLRENETLRRREEPPVLYDFIYGDAFNDFSVPWHLTTREFSEKVKHLLTPRGVYLVNIIDIYPRTVYAAGEFEPGSSANGVPVAIPEVLIPALSANHQGWIACPAPYQDFEIAPTDEDGLYRIAVRGRMPQRSRDRMLKLAGDHPEFRGVVETLYRDSRQQQPGQFLGRFVKTVSEVFPYVYVFSSDPDLPNPRRDTLIIACSMRELDLSDLHRSGGYWNGDPFAWFELNPQTNEKRFYGQMESVLELSRGMALTDDFAPVDNLLIPVFARQD